MIYTVKRHKINILHLGDVFTFSTQTKGKKKISYGTAGDCYSQKSGCPQGRFSVDLTGTSFKIASGVRWRSHGYFSTAQVNIGVSANFYWSPPQIVKLVFFCRKNE